MKKTIIRISIGIAIGIIIAGVGFIIWAETPSPAGISALTALEPDSAITITKQGNYILFEPKENKSDIGFIFYPGGHVDYRSYSPILRQIALHGTTVYLLRVNLNLAFFDIEAGSLALRNGQSIACWITGGHSLGGVASAYFAYNHPEISGIVFWASYPADNRLVNTPIRMMSIYGTEDGGLDDGKKIEQYKQNEVPDTEFIIIQGGNHGQFGDYGPQPGDKPATITPENQWQQIAEATIRFIESCGNSQLNIYE